MIKLTNFNSFFIGSSNVEEVTGGEKVVPNTFSLKKFLKDCSAVVMKKKIEAINPVNQILKSPLPYPFLGIFLSFLNDQQYTLVTIPEKSWEYY